MDRGAPAGPYTKYQDAGPDLQARLGDYCSYCERQIETHLAVEHIQPKSLQHNLRTEWTNFLLSCVNCNSSKGDAQINLLDYVWPDSDNTLRAFDYIRGGIIGPNSALAAAVQLKADETIKLFGLDRIPGNTGREPTSADKRWLRRHEAWQKAETYRQKLEQENTEIVRQLIVEVATARGEFSIWWNVFRGDLDMRRRLRVAFLGTHGGSFDANEDLLPRQGGQV